MLQIKVTVTIFTASLYIKPILENLENLENTKTKDFKLYS